MKPIRTAAALLIAAWAGSSMAADAGAAKTVDPQAVKALETMGSYLRSLPRFALSADTTTDFVDDNGQALQFARHAEMQVVRPNRLKASVSGEQGTRSMYFDGKTFTLYGSQHNFYASAPAPKTIGELVGDIADKYGIETPLADLFYWGSDPDQGKELTAARAVGEERIGDATCTHYAFRKPGTDWQLWIRKGAQPLPCKLVITATDIEARPQHAVRFNWQTQPSFGNDVFSFKPPKDAKRIAFARNEASKPASAKPSAKQ
ncbi:DUF2092 domain-containing protein [Jeongeupia chitinilytica]|uniref:DUF2092 domain-containing protein n=1 Tax=Jeongeupia chitinilytica TaxID=1041641 RepID=A0ABQ3H3M7_9NEIS|nr:DUF2092 domain-containing protein [Jeongeupia chitinilytica]GHD68835.1 hypothetical protein GCM10007350_34650 [Jeongeupia chitinilytica]